MSRARRPRARPSLLLQTRRSAALLAALVSATTACGGEAPSPSPAAYRPDFAGCAAYRADQVCEVTPAQRTLRVALDGAPESLDVRLGAQPLATTADPIAGGHRVAVVLPEAAAAPGIAGTLTLDVGSAPARRRFTLRIEGARKDDRIERAHALAAEGKRAEARAALGDPAGYDSPLRGRAWGRLARIDLADARIDAAIEGLGRALDGNLDAGRVSEAALDAFALAHTLLANGRSPGEARAALARAATAIAAWPEGRAHVGYYEALIARDAGDVRPALRRLDEAESAASRLGVSSVLRASVLVRARLLQTLGRPEEALRALDAAAAATPATVHACERALLDATRAWVEVSIVLAARRPSPPDGALRERLLRLVDVYTRDCPRPADVQTAHVNVAIAALLAGDTEAAASHLAAARASAAPPIASVAAWLIELDGRLRMARGRPADAVAPFEELAARAAAAGDPETHFRGLVGAGRALLAAGKTDAAIEALRRAETALDRLSVAVPLGAGRARFLGDRGASARALVEALLLVGRPAEALAAARAARSRALASEARIDRIGSLPPDARARWEAAIAAYRRARQAIDAAAEDDWRLARSRVEDALEQRRALIEEANRALDDALAELSWEPAPAGSKPEPRSAGPATAPRATGPIPVPSSPPDGVLLLAVFERGDRGHVLFAQAGKEVTSRPLPEPAGMSPEALSAALLEPIAPLLAAASRVVFLGYSEWNGIDVHALPLRGAPLSALVPVAYGLDVGERSRQARGPAVVVSDPSGDLPQAAREGEKVASRLGEGRVVTLLRGAAASKAEVLAALRGAEMLHFAGHGVFEEDAPWESGLVMEGGRLVPGDVLALGGAPRVVVLSGCETGRAPARVGVDMSLAYAFLAAGSEAVVATSRPVADAVGAAMSEALYRDVAAPAWDPVAALRRAQEHVRAATPGADWASYRVLVR